MSDKNKKITIGILLAALVGLAIFSYKNNEKQIVDIAELTQEKETIFADLTKLEKQYNLAINQKTFLSKELSVQKENIIKFRDSIKKIKNTNWKLISFYKNKIKELTRTTQKMIRVNDSLVKKNNMLNLENQNLYEQKETLTSTLQEQTNFNDTLVKQNLNLAKKVALGEVIHVNSFKVDTYDQRRNGKFKLSEKARRVDTFKIEFLLNENPIAKEKDIVAHVVVKSPTGEVLSKKGTFLTVKNIEKEFSDKTVIPYKTHAIATDIIIQSKNKLKKGIYTIVIYIDNKLETAINKTLI